MDSMFSIGVRFSTTIFLGINFMEKTLTQLPQVRSLKQIGAEFFLYAKLWVMVYCMLTIVLERLQFLV